MHCSREFVNTEEPKNWNHSYEVSDHLSAEDNSGTGSGTGTGTQALHGEDKENISLSATSVCERTHIDITLNLQTSVDVTLLPCELSRKNHKPLGAVRDSLALTQEERQGLQDTLYEHRIMDKTLDVMSGSLVARMQKSVLHNTNGGELAPIGIRESSIHTTANCMSDSFMDITPLAPTPADIAPAQHPIQQCNRQLKTDDIELEMFNDQHNIMANEKENICPAQKSLFMELEEDEVVKPLKNKTQHEAVDICFASSLNVSAERDLLPPGNISFESASSGNSTINFKDESVLVPLDMISGKRISKKINLRQLNDELEAGKIQLFPNGPKTPTTDRKAQMKRYWHGLGLVGMETEEECPTRDIKSSIKPRGMLNFSESMAMSPAPMAPSKKEIRDKANDKVKDKEDKHKYRLSQADEIMLNNTNFLAHARLGDETQSRNTSKNSTRRETIYDYSDLDFERPASRQDYRHPISGFRPRQSIHHPEEMDADQSVSFSVIPAVKTAAPILPEEMDADQSVSFSPIQPRRTVHQPVEMEADQSVVSFSAIPSVKTTAPPPPRRTIHQPVEMEADQSLVSLSMVPTVKTTAPPPRRTIHNLEEMEADQSVISFSAIPAVKSTDPPPPRRTIHQAVEMEADQSLVSLSTIPAVKTSAPPPRRTIHNLEEMEADQSALFSATSAVKTTAPPSRQDQEVTELRRTKEASQETVAPPYVRIKTKRRETLLMQVSMEEEIIDLPMELYSASLEKNNSKSRHTLHLAEDLENENLVNPGQELPFKITMPPEDPSKSKQNVVLDEPTEEEFHFSMKDPPDDLQMATKSRQTLGMEEEEMHPTTKEPLTQYPSQKSRKTIIMSEAIEQDKSILQPREPSLLKYKEAPHGPRTRHTLLIAEPLEEDPPAAFKSNIPIRESSRSKARHTILMAEPILEDMGCNPAEKQQTSESMQQTLVRSEGTTNMEGQISGLHTSKKIHLGMPEEMEQDMDLESPASSRPTETDMRSDFYQSSNPRKTTEPIEEDEIVLHSTKKSLPKLPAYTQEPIEDEMRSNGKEETNVYQSSKPRKTILISEPIEEESSFSKHNAIEASSVPYRQQKSRHTLVKAEPIEEDLEIAFKPNHLPSQEENPRPKSRNTILVAEQIVEDLSLRSINKSASLDYQSPQETMPKPDIQAITPMPNPRLTSIYRDLGNFTPGMSLTEFEDQEEMCKTPLPKSKQRQRSIYHNAKMDTSGFGTPVNQANHKRLPKHLTPNLPDSKKRHTQLFANSQMEMEVDMEDGAWKGANLALETEAETHKFLPSFRIDHFDETVQPVRDYHAALTQLGQVSSLDDVLQLPQPSELEEKPITISDVNTYFLKEAQEEQRKSCNRESGSSADRTFKSYAVAHSKFLNLSGDTTIFAAAIDVDDAEEEEEMEEMEPQNQIDNEQISLVSTLAEETDENEEVQEPDHQPELCQAQITPLVIAGSSASCRKCGNCNRSLSETRRSTDSFVLPQLNLFEFTKDRQRLRRLRLKPSFKEMQKHWQMKSQETEMNETLDETRVEERLFHWDKTKLMQKLMRRNDDKASDKSRESFFDRLDRLLVDQQPNWIFDFQLKASRQLIFYHRQLTTFRIVVNYKMLDEQDESDIRVRSIAKDKAVAGGPPERWTTFEHYLNFQLSLKMPPNLTDALGGSDEESFRKFLQRIDQIVVGIKRTFYKLMTVLTATNARLLRQSNRIFVRKTVLKCIEDEPLVRFERINFDVQIANVEEICFTDILQPELYLFNENLQFMPKGIAFLEAFLPNPEQYLKTST
ncbi:hypothetical protein KR038_000590 [Drosophila bunnanda]|nr:hypothetical protein KR038_000590 [Drosophila bunnanda]